MVRAVAQLTASLSKIRLSWKDFPGEKRSSLLDERASDEKK
jgi:hypothetical protein